MKHQRPPVECLISLYYMEYYGKPREIRMLTFFEEMARMLLRELLVRCNFYTFQAEEWLLSYSLIYRSKGNDTESIFVFSLHSNFGEKNWP